LTGFYAFAAESGCEAVYHTGDLIDGHRVYRGQEFELRDVGMEAQLARLADTKLADIETRFITGNHDQSFKTAAGVHVGKAIEAAAPGWRFLGEEQARVTWRTPAGDYSQELKTAVAEAFVPAFEALKGAGAITEAEGKAALAALANLGTGMSEVQMRREVQKYVDKLATGLDVARKQAGMGGSPFTYEDLMREKRRRAAMKEPR
jgi:hypothetical protein